ncbi:MAG: GNAT family N-acetyltransferase [Ilumatobacter sp.]
MIRIVALAAEGTHDLRRRVLRDDDRDAKVDWPGDHDSDTLHLGALDSDGVVVAVSTWLTRAGPQGRADRCRQLRGMATDPGGRGTGLGVLLLDEGVRRAVTDGFDVAWANARVEAVGFYVGQGWTVSGPVFETAETGLPHRLVTRRLS